MFLTCLLLSPALFTSVVCVRGSVKLASLCHSVVEQHLLPLATQASGFLDRLYPDGRLSRVCNLLTSHERSRQTFSLFELRLNHLSSH